MNRYFFSLFFTFALRTKLYKSKLSHSQETDYSNYHRHFRHYDETLG